jgi:hypothetical protein
LVKSTCKFRGLADFPFDKLNCTLEFGSWTHSGLYIRPIKMGGVGYSIGGSETAGQSFAEFTLTSVTSSAFVYPPFPAAPEEDWPVLLYNVECQRASRPYVRSHLLLQFMLTFCAFACMWIPPHVGERMGLAITSLLASVASEISVTEKLPNSEEANWFVIFSLASMAFSVAIVFQSAAVIYFHYFTGSSLTPTFVKWIVRQGSFHEKENKQGGGNSDQGGTLRHHQNGDEVSDENSDDLSIDMKGNVAKFCNTNPDRTTRRTSTANNGGTRVSHSDEDESIPFGTHPNALKASRSPELPRRDAEDFRDVRARENNLRWQEVSQRIDDFSRLFFPTAYVVFLAVIMSKAG